ncbi:MAG: hypothetical protein WC879_08080 [Melioribacteraceae bacterium]
MQNHIKIREEDIYRFVFSPETLSKDKFDYLTANRERFKVEIALCLEITNTSNTEEIRSLTEAVLQKINSPNVIKLLPQISKPIEENGLKLAAASVLKEKKSNSMSFTDSESKYLVRIVKTDSQNLLYLFTEDKTKQKYIIKLFPSEVEYQITDISQPIEIIEEKVIDGIVLE